MPARYAYVMEEHRYKVMIIDDDAPIREYLRDSIAWDALGLTFSCEAGDSETASELFELHRPNLIITDVSIPVISGLALARQFLKEDKEIRVIVITGFNDFEMAREAVALGAVELLSKPIVPEELNQSIEKAIRSMEDARRAQQEASLLESLLKENGTVLREHLIAQLFLSRTELSEQQIIDQLNILDLPFPESNLAALYIKLDPDPPAEAGGAAFPTAFRRLCASIFQENGFRIFSFFNQVDQLNCLIGWSSADGESRIEYLLARLLEETRHYFHTGFHAGLGSTVNAFSDLHLSASQAKLALRFNDPASPNINSYKNLGHLSMHRPPCSKEQLQQISSAVQSGETGQFELLLQQIIPCSKAYDAGPALPPSQDDALASAREVALEILSHLSKLCYSTGLYPWNTVNYAGTMAAIFAASEREAIIRELTGICEKLSAVLTQQRFQSNNQLIRQAKIYIQQSLSDASLSLEDVASHVGLSKIYFCQLFHKEAGESFNSYLTRKRVEKAKGLLRDTSQKIFEISDAAGYSNPKYFNYVFKKAVGVTPLEYRKGSPQ